MKYVALAMAVLYFVIWLYGGIYYSKIGHTLVYYLAGWAVLIAYLPLYWYRVMVEDPRVEGRDSGRDADEDPGGLLVTGPHAPGPNPP
jgi:hypothetical protein